MAHDPAAFADMVTLTVKAALAPLLERVAGVEARVAQALTLDPALAALRDRVVVVETKAAAPVVVPEPHDYSPMLERLAATEARVARLAAVELTVGELRDKFLTLETKAAVVPPEPREPLGPVLERVAATEARVGHLVALEVILDQLRDKCLALETKAAIPREMTPHHPNPEEMELAILEALDPVKATLAAVQERVAVLEVRPLLPGPAGKDGAPGLNGKDGTPGKDGLAGLSYEGVYQEGKAYEPGQLATWGGSAWHCNEPTTSKPGEGSQAWTLMIKRGRDGKDGKDAEVVPVVSLSGGRR